MTGLETWAVIAAGDLISGHTTVDEANRAAADYVARDGGKAGVYRLSHGYETKTAVVSFAGPEQAAPVPSRDARRAPCDAGEHDWAPSIVCPGDKYCKRCAARQAPPAVREL